MDYDEKLDEHPDDGAVESLSLDEREKHLENKVKELHSNVRHVTQLAMNWFAFFVTLNYLTIGWLAKDADTKNVNPLIIRLVATLFIVQNCLGIFGIHWVKKTAKTGAAQITSYENLLLKTDGTSRDELLKCKSTPANLYLALAWSLMVILSLLMLAWGIIACCYYKQ